MVGYLFVQAYEEKRKRGESKKKERSLGTKKTNFRIAQETKSEDRTQQAPNASCVYFLKRNNTNFRPNTIFPSSGRMRIKKK